MKLLKQLTEAFGPSGHEDEVRQIIIDELKPICDKVWTNTMGSVVGLKKGSGKKADKKKIMIAGHIDEIGFMVTHISDKGWVRFTPLGGFDPRTLVCQRAVVLGKGKNKLVGTLNVAGKPIHMQSPEERKKELKVSDFFIDLGLDGKTVKRKVEIGDPIVWQRDFMEIGDTYQCKAMDDRVGAFVMIEALRRTKNNTHDIYAVGTVQEEVGLRGAQTSAYELDPDIAIALDVTLAIDTPGGEEHGRISDLGKGITISLMNSAVISDRGLVKEFREIGDRKKIPYQLEILPRGGTDAGAMQRAKGGAKAITLSVPTRYVHSVNETVHKTDVEAGVNLLAAFLNR
ncbi:MAG TPA: M42 family peptidase [Firmicutes bacterium]|mgnify:CR=1 FL=1|nr:M42 family peptidase [Bacillota bacterium]